MNEEGNAETIMAPTLDFSFYKTFSRFEFALKKAKYAKTQSGAVSADWDWFAKELGDNFFNEIKSNGLANTRAGSGNLHSGDKWSFCLTSA